MKDMNWPERVAYLENQLADSDRDNRRLREFIEGLPDGDEIVRLRGLLAETNAKMMIMHNESISLHARLAEATGIISQRALELADTQGQLTEAKRELARWAKLNPLAQQIADPTLRGIVVSFLDRFGYGASKFDMQAGINRAMAAAGYYKGAEAVKINDEGSSNAAHWHERAMKAEARLQKIMARCADLLDEDQFNELDAMTRATVTVTASEVAK